MAPSTSSRVDDALAAQAASCALVGSPLYATVLLGLLADHRTGGITAELLDGVTERPVHDALPLRYLATGHRLALAGLAPQLARHYPSCGGAWSGDDSVVDDFLATVVERRTDFVAGVRRHVQTNEVGRAPVIASGMAWIAARTRLPIDQLEIGSSAGLLSRWDHYAYDTGSSRCGDPVGGVRFGPGWWQPPAPDLAAGPTVMRRRASDIHPIDTTTAAGRTTMLSFVWPDQLERIERLRSALAVAEASPLHIDAADAGAWLRTELGHGLRAGATTVVFHSIVWQYLPGATRDGVRAALMSAAPAATPEQPLFWLRMEPATRDHAELRVTSWPSLTGSPEGDQQHLADVGYHGADVRWRPTD